MRVFPLHPKHESGVENTVCVRLDNSSNPSTRQHWVSANLVLINISRDNYSVDVIQALSLTVVSRLHLKMNLSQVLPQPQDYANYNIMKTLLLLPPVRVPLLWPGRRNSSDGELRAPLEADINFDESLAIIPAQANGRAIGLNPAVANIESDKQQVVPRAVLGAEGSLVEGNAGCLADKVTTKGGSKAPLDNEDVGPQDLAGSDLSVGVCPGAGGLDDLALLHRLVSVLVFKVGSWEEHTLLVKVKHSLLGMPPICLKTRVLGPLTGPGGTRI